MSRDFVHKWHRHLLVIYDLDVGNHFSSIVCWREVKLGWSDEKCINTIVVKVLKSSYDINAIIIVIVEWMKEWRKTIVKKTKTWQIKV